MKRTAVILLFLLGGCAPLQVAKTTASLTLPNGLVAHYESTKDQQGVEVIIEKVDPKTNKVVERWKLVVEKAVTPEAAFIAMAERDKVTAETLQVLVEKLIAAAP